MTRPTLLTPILALALLLGTSACGGDDATADDAAAPAPASAEAIDCPPLTFTIDGEAVTGLDHAFAYSEPGDGSSQGGYGVDVFNHAAATCEDVLASSRDVPEGEVNVRAFVAEGSTRGVVATGSKNNFAQGVELVRKPESVGDTVAICVSDVAWTVQGFGSDAGTRYTIDGLLQAEYCGERVR